MKIVYICHPIGGDVKGNIDKIKKIIRKINLTIPDVVPFAPYLGDVISMDDSNQVERFRCIQNDFEFFKMQRKVGIETRLKQLQKIEQEAQAEARSLAAELRRLQNGEMEK